MTRTGWAITISRHLDAPPQRIWRAFANQTEFRGWFASQGDDFTIEFASFDFSVGGVITFTSSFEGELAYRVAWCFTELVTYQRIVTLNDLWVRREDGTVSEEPMSSRVVITLTEQGAGTEISWAETGSSENAAHASEQAEDIASHHLMRLAMHVSSAAG